MQDSTTAKDAEPIYIRTHDTATDTADGETYSFKSESSINFCPCMEDCYATYGPNKEYFINHPQLRALEKEIARAQKTKPLKVFAKHLSFFSNWIKTAVKTWRQERQDQKKLNRNWRKNRFLEIKLRNLCQQNINWQPPYTAVFEVEERVFPFGPTRIRAYDVFVEENTEVDEFSETEFEEFINLSLFSDLASIGTDEAEEIDSLTR